MRRPASRRRREPRGIEPSTLDVPTHVSSSYHLGAPRAPHVPKSEGRMQNRRRAIRSGSSQEIAEIAEAGTRAGIFRCSSTSAFSASPVQIQVRSGFFHRRSQRSPRQSGEQELPPLACPPLPPFPPVQIPIRSEHHRSHGSPRIRGIDHPCPSEKSVVKSSEFFTGDHRDR